MDTMKKGNKDVQERVMLLQKEKDQVGAMGDNISRDIAYLFFLNGLLLFRFQSKF